MSTWQWWDILVSHSLPAPSVPSFTNVNNYGFQSVVVGIVAFAQSVSLAALMAKKHHYDIDANKVSGGEPMVDVPVRESWVIPHLVIV